MIVFNVRGTSDLKCKCESWLSHWETFSKQKATKCCVANCFNPAEVGAHVRIHNHPAEIIYIAPMCHVHNQSVMGFGISPNITLVSANRRDTCDR